jgi:hypothetical protein
MYLFIQKHSGGENVGKRNFKAIFFLLRKEVRDDFNIHGTKYFYLGCCFPPKIKKYDVVSLLNNCVYLIFT